MSDSSFAALIARQAEKIQIIEEMPRLFSSLSLQCECEFSRFSWISYLVWIISDVNYNTIYPAIDSVPEETFFMDVDEPIEIVDHMDLDTDEDELNSMDWTDSVKFESEGITEAMVYHQSSFIPELEMAEIDSTGMAYAQSVAFNEWYPQERIAVMDNSSESITNICHTRSHFSDALANSAPHE